MLTPKIDPSKGNIQTTNYGYTSNRLTSLSDAETASYGYNNRGDMTRLEENGATYTPEYDLLHNLTSYCLGLTCQASTTIASYGYDGDGLRVKKTAGGVTTIYHHDQSGKLLSETDTSGNRIADYVYVNGKLAAKVDSTGAVSYYHVDPAGTPTAMTDSSGNVIWRAEYLPFGEEQLLVNTKANDKMFVGKEKDEETGLYYFGARYLQDRNARFVSVDPVGPVDPASGRTNEKMLLNPQMLNRYAYTINNPYKYSDPDGKFLQLLVPLAVPAFEYLGYTVLGLTTFKTLEQAYNNYRNGMYNEGADNADSENKASRSRDGNYIPAPKDLNAFPDAKPAKPKTPVQGGGKKRARWKDDDNIYEWDYKKGTVEKYSKNGKKHMGDFDPENGRPVGPAVKTRKVEP